MSDHHDRNEMGTVGVTDPVGGAHSSPLRAIKRTHRSEEVRLQIEQAIRRGDFAPGERLPSERELVGTFGVSRVSVREAIRSLQAVGLVRVHQGRGAFVTDRRSGLGEPMARWLDVHSDEVLELLAVRGALDEQAAVGAVEHAGAAALASVRAAETAFADAVKQHASMEDLVPLDIDLHVGIAEASSNRLLYDLLSDLHHYLAESRYLALAPRGRPEQSATEHAAIVDALEARDAAAARHATARHIASVREVVSRSLDDEGRGAAVAGGEG